MDDTKEVRQIPIEEIIPNRFQPRINFDEKALNDLSNSIKQHGIIQPLVLRPLGDKYEIIAGERRYKAACMAGLTTVPAIITNMDDDTSAEVALVENVQRKDLTSIEEARSYKTMLDRGNLTQEELAKKMGLSQSTIANKLRLLNLSPEVQDALMQEKISERHARALLAISDKAEQVRWLNRILNERLTVRQLDLAIKDELSEKNNINTVAPQDGDIPIVNINPDIDQIINNAVDINPGNEKPQVDLMGQTPLPDIQPQNIENSELGPITANTEVVSDVNNDIKNNPMPNKFFNFLEDEEVNMNTEDPVVTNVDIPAPSMFDFKPEFVEEPTQQVENEPAQFETSVAPSVDNQVIESLEVNNPVTDNQLVQPAEESIFQPTDQQLPSDPLDLLYNMPQPAVENNQVIEETIPQQQNQFFNIPAEAPSYVENNQSEANNTIVQPEINPTNSVINPVEEQPITYDNVPQPEVNPVVIDNSVVEPIPAVTGDNVVDPVTFFDTLDPNFEEKVKESEGLDLKTAINNYRDLTGSLQNRGFVINIDEADAADKYHIEIDIFKE